MKVKSDEEILCWTRIQTESGQSLAKILLRKELERIANGGTFFWGVGNPPAKCVKYLEHSEINIPVIFSIMKSKPKIVDTTPEALYYWSGYLDNRNKYISLPKGTLVISRGKKDTEPSRHYALICYNNDILNLTDSSLFNHLDYVNYGTNGKPVGSSQVTSILRMSESSNKAPQYKVNLKAKLVSSMWVKLCKPYKLSDEKAALLDKISEITTTEEWMAILELIKGNNI